MIDPISPFEGTGKAFFESTSTNMPTHKAEKEAAVCDTWMEKGGIFQYLMGVTLKTS